MEYIYVVTHLSYDNGTVCTTALYAYYDKQKAIEEARKLNKQDAKAALSVSKKYRCNCVDHYFVEALTIT